MDEAYERGIKEHPEKGFYDNPYREGTVEFRRWVDGKVQAIIDERKGNQPAAAIDPQQQP